MALQRVEQGLAGRCRGRDCARHPFDPPESARCILMGQYDEASSWARRALQEKSDYLPAIRILAASEALAGHAMEEKAIEGLRKLQPELRIADLKYQVPLRRPIDAAKYADGLRKAGLPE